MQRSLIVLALVSFAGVLAGHAASVRAQHTHGILGVFDDAQLTRNFGDMTGPVKEVYLGLRLDENNEGFTGLEFSVTGLQAFDAWNVVWLTDPNLIIGTIAAPADTTTGTGGINVAWPSCQLGNPVLLAKLTLFSANAPTDHVLQVRRRFPPSNPFRPFVFSVGCDEPCNAPRISSARACVHRQREGTYTLNPGIAVEPRNWGVIKLLYRDSHSSGGEP